MNSRRSFDVRLLECRTPVTLAFDNYGVVKKEPHCRTCGTPKIMLRSGILRCPACRKERGREYYHRSEKRRDSQRRHYIRRTYGLSIEELSEMLAAQNDCCAICGRRWSECAAAKHSRYGTMFLQHLYVDHDHSTGGVRGLLCNNCNAGIAMFSEETDRLKAAIAYLRAYRT